MTGFTLKGTDPNKSVLPKRVLTRLTQLDPDEKHVIKEMVEGILLKHQARVYGSSANV